MNNLRIIYTLILFTVCISCTHNNGDIGNLFGEWSVDEVSIDGKRFDDFQYGKVFFRFQADHVYYQQMLDPNFDQIGYSGTWSRENNSLILNFNHLVQENVPSGQIPPTMLIPPQAVTVCNILKESSKTLVFSFIDTNGQTIVFNLRKLY